MAQITERCMAVHYLDLLSDKDLSKDWERREDRGEGGRSVDYPVWDVIDF